MNSTWTFFPTTRRRHFTGPVTWQSALKTASSWQRISPETAPRARRFRQSIKRQKRDPLRCTIRSPRVRTDLWKWPSTSTSSTRIYELHALQIVDEAASLTCSGRPQSGHSMVRGAELPPGIFSNLRTKAIECLGIGPALIPEESGTPQADSKGKPRLFSGGGEFESVASSSVERKRGSGAGSRGAMARPPSIP